METRIVLEGMEETGIEWVPVLEKSFQMSSRNLRCLDWNEDNYLFIGFQGSLCALNLCNFNISEENVNFPTQLKAEEGDEVAFNRLLKRLESDSEDLSDSVADRNFLAFGELISVGVEKKEEEFFNVKGIPLHSLALYNWLENCIGVVVSGSSHNTAYLFVRKQNGGSLIPDTSSGSPWRNAYQFHIQVGMLTDLSFCHTVSLKTEQNQAGENVICCFSGTNGAELWLLCGTTNASPSLEAHFRRRLTTECVGSCKLLSDSSSILISLGQQNGQLCIYQLANDLDSFFQVAHFGSSISSIIVEQCWYCLSSRVWMVVFSGGNSLCSVELSLLDDNQTQLKHIANVADAHKAFITAICCNQWGHFATSSLDGSVRLWTKMLQLITVIRNEDQSYSLHGLAFSPNGLCLAVLGSIRLETDERVTGAKPHSSVIIYCPFEGKLYEEKYAQVWRHFLDDSLFNEETYPGCFMTWDMELAIFRVWQAKKDKNRMEQFINEINRHSSGSLVYRRILYCLKCLATKYFAQTWSEPLWNEQSALITEHICNSLNRLYSRQSLGGKSTKCKDWFGSLSKVEQGAVEAMLGYLRKWQPHHLGKHLSFETGTDADVLEFCPICKERNLSICCENTPLVSSCRSGHIFRRCILSLLPIVHSNNSLTCPSCRSSAIYFSSEMEWLTESYVCTLCQQPLSFIEMSPEEELRLFRSLKQNINRQVG